MPITDITNLNRGRNLEYSRQLIRQNLLECYYLIIKLSEPKNYNDNIVNDIINTHKNFINKMYIYGKNKYKTLLLLKQYQKSKNKSIALMILTNSLNKMSLFNQI